MEHMEPPLCETVGIVCTCCLRWRDRERAINRDINEDIEILMQLIKQAYPEIEKVREPLLPIYESFRKYETWLRQADRYLLDREGKEK